MTLRCTRPMKNRDGGCDGDVPPAAVGRSEHRVLRERRIFAVPREKAQAAQEWAKTSG